ncbi:MAG: DUF2157 domain-containing protein, partial [Alphaproteobacteria bacterium]|nr:DUF2157 domain-containing protein [Alphaproteobacteria bacterium]
ERGWVTPANAELILKSAEDRPSARRMPVILAILGAVLIGFAAMSFVAANWNEISKLAKLAMIFGAMWAAWIAAIMLEKRNHPAYAQAAVLAGLALFGAGIMLVAQIYHIVTDDPAGVLAWAIASLAAALLLPSRPALALGILLTVIWSVFALQLDGSTPHWAFWFLWAASAFLAFRLAWGPGFHLVLIAGFVWQAVNAETISDAFGIDATWLLMFATLEALILWLAAMLAEARATRFSGAAQAYAIVIAFVLFWIYQLTPESHALQDGLANLGAAICAAATLGLAALILFALSRRLLELRHAAAIAAMAFAALVYPYIAAANPPLVPWLYAALFLAFAAWLVSYGTARDSRFAVNFGFAAFGVELLWLYFETLGTLLDTALFFAAGGVLLIVGAFVMERMRRRLVAQTEAKSGGAS